jgi:hypothetical protein
MLLEKNQSIQGEGGVEVITIKVERQRTRDQDRNLRPASVGHLPDRVLGMINGHLLNRRVPGDRKTEMFPLDATVHHVAILHEHTMLLLDTAHLRGMDPLSLRGFHLQNARIQEIRTSCFLIDKAR